MQERDGIGRGNYPSDTLSFCPSKRRVEVPRPRDLEKRHAYSERLHSGLKLAPVLGHWIGRTHDDVDSGPDELGDQTGEAFGLALTEGPLDDEVPALDVAQLAHRIEKWLPLAGLRGI